MNNNLLNEITAVLENSFKLQTNQSAGIGSKARMSATKLGMFGGSRPIGAGAQALLGIGEQTSSRVASIASRGLENPASLTLDEIKTVCASALTQTANRG